MIDIILKMFLGKYFESCDSNFIDMNMNAGIEIRNIIIKNDEINNFLKSKNIDIEIVYLKIEKINISFKTLSGILTLKLYGVDLRVKPNIHRNASKGIKNKIKKFLNSNQEEDIKLCSPYDTQNIYYESSKLENEILCCCCEKYKNIENSIGCYNNYNNIKKYICNDCSILKNKNDENNLNLIQKQSFLKNKCSKYSNNINGMLSSNIPPINMIDNIKDMDAYFCKKQNNSNYLNLNNTEHFSYYNSNSQLNNKKERKYNMNTFKNKDQVLRNSLKSEDLNKFSPFLTHLNNIKKLSENNLNKINDYNYTNKLDENIHSNIHKQEESNLNTLSELNKSNFYDFCKLKNNHLSNNNNVFKKIYVHGNNKMNYENNLNEYKSLNTTKNLKLQYPYNCMEKKDHEFNKYCRIYKKNSITHSNFYQNPMMPEKNKIEKLISESVLKQNETSKDDSNENYYYINKINERLNSANMSKGILINEFYNEGTVEKSPHTIKNNYNLLYIYNDISNNKDKIKIDNIFNFK